MYAFYPYALSGVTINNDEELEEKLPTYRAGWLLPVKDRLASRKKIDAWYLPTWPRSWQYGRDVKLVSTYFGQAGSFAVDTVGRHVVVDGHVWILKRPGAMSVPELTRLLHGYCALLNSEPFQDVLRIYARSITGGYIRLEPRFINAVPLPDLRQATFGRMLLPQLATLGEQIAEAGLSRVQAQVDELVRTIYGM